MNSKGIWGEIPGWLLFLVALLVVIAIIILYKKPLGILDSLLGINTK